MFSCLSYIAAMLVFLGRFRRRWLWLPTVFLGVFLFLVFLSWNKTPSFSDKIEVIQTNRTDSSTVSVSVKHPYFSLNNFSGDFWGFWTDYGKSCAGVDFSIRQATDKSDEDILSNYPKYKSEVLSLFPCHRMDSIGTIYEFRVRKELFGNMDYRKVNNKLIKAWDDKGFCVVKRVAKYDDDVCVDSLRVLVGVKKFTSSNIPVGYSSKMYYTLMRLLRMEDISQFNYSLSLVGNVNSINKIEVDFGGPVDIKGLWPIPDIVEPTRIVYHSNERISEVKEAGTIKMFCQSLESVNVQNVRLFVLTTLASLCFAYTLRESGVFLLFCCRWIKKKWENNKNSIERFFKNLSGGFWSLWIKPNKNRK